MMWYHVIFAVIIVVALVLLLRDFIQAVHDFMEDEDDGWY